MKSHTQQGVPRSHPSLLKRGICSCFQKQEWHRPISFIFKRSSIYECLCEIFSILFFFFFFFFGFFWAPPLAYGNSQGRGQIGTAAPHRHPGLFQAPQVFIAFLVTGPWSTLVAAEISLLLWACKVPVWGCGL